MDDLTSEELHWGRDSMAAWVTAFLHAKQHGEDDRNHPVLSDIATEAANDPRKLAALLSGAAALGASLVHFWAGEVDENPEQLWQEFLQEL